MPFDLSSAKPVAPTASQAGFDLASAKPVEEGTLGTMKRWLGDVARGGLSNLATLAEGAAAFNSVERPSFSKGEAGKIVVGPSESPNGELNALVQQSLPARQDGYGTSMREAAGSWLTTPIGKVAGLIQALGGGAGSEAAANIFGDTGGVRLLGGLAGGGGTAGLQNAAQRSLGRTTEEVAKIAATGVTEQQFRAAQTYMAKLKSEGTDIDLAQALEAIGTPRGAVAKIRDVLANKVAGRETQRILHEQPSNLEMQSDVFIGNMPGEVIGESQAANNLQRAATEVINLAKNFRSGEVRALYAAAKDLPPEKLRALGAAAQRLAAQPGATKELKAAAADFQRKLAGGDTLAKLEAAAESARQAVATAGTPSAKAAARRALADVNQELENLGTKPVSALDVDTWIAEAVGPYKGTPLSPVNPKALGQVKGLAGELNTSFQKASPEVAKAEGRFRAITESTINPLKQGPVGQLAGPKGYAPDVQASIARMQSLFKAGVDPQSSLKASPIRVAAKELAKADPDAFADAAKTYYSGKISQAFDATIAGAPATNADAAQRLWKSLRFDDRKQYQGMLDTVTSIAEQSGQDPVRAAKGLESFAQMIKAMANRPGTTGTLSVEELYKLGGSSRAADFLRTFGIMPFERVARKIEDRTVNSMLADFDQLLTTPEGVDKLIALSKVPSTSKRAAQLILGAQVAGGQVAVNSPRITDE